MALSHTKENPIIVGLDIGTTKIACIVAQRDQHGKLKILGLGKTPSFGVTRGEVSNIKLTTDAILTSVAEAERQSGHKIKSVFVGIAGQHISSKQSRDIYTLSNADDEIPAPSTTPGDANNANGANNVNGGANNVKGNANNADEHRSTIPDIGTLPSLASLAAAAARKSSYILNGDEINSIYSE